MLKIDNITIAYKDVPTVMDFSLHMAQGQIVSLVGESGSGKTTVIRAVLGLSLIHIFIHLEISPYKYDLS